MGKVIEMFKKEHEKRDIYSKNAAVRDIQTIAKLYEKMGNDIRNFNDVEKGDLEKKIIEAHHETHGDLLKSEHGFDYKTIANLPYDKQTEIMNILYDTDINTLRDRIIQQGSDVDLNRFIQERAQQKQERFIVGVGDYFSKLNENDQLELVKENVLPAVGKDYVFNEGILKAQPEGVGRILAQIYSGADAKRAVRPLTYKNDKKKGKVIQMNPKDQYKKAA